MKRGIWLLIAALVLSLLTACAGTPAADSKTEEAAADYGEAVVLAKKEFERATAALEAVEVTETATMARADSTNRLVVQFTYTAANGGGVYGVEIEKTGAGAYEIVRKGADVTIDNLVREP